MDFLSSRKKNQNNLMHLHDKEVEVWHPNGQINESIDVVKPDCNGRIDFLALNEAFVRNPLYIGSGAGKTAAMMSAICQMNAFNVENFHQVGEYMKESENHFATIIHNSNSSSDNKLQITANKIS